MKITVLVENTSRRPELKTEAGLSVYIEAAGRRLMMDFGFHGAVVPNAAALGVDLAAVEFGVLSHGHDDHSGGISAFRKINPAAPIYAQQKAFGAYCCEEPDGSYTFGGLADALRGDPNIRLCTGVTELGNGMLLFDGITGRELFSPANRCLVEKTDAGYIQDAFVHEQGLVLPCGSGWALLSGCSHNGVLNVISRAQEVMGSAPSLVLGGFHLSDPGTDRGYDPALVEALAERLLRIGAKYYTCHCTGLPAYGILKARMGDAVDYAACGDVIEA